MLLQAVGPQKDTLMLFLRSVIDPGGLKMLWSHCSPWPIWFGISTEDACLPGKLLCPWDIVKRSFKGELLLQQEKMLYSLHAPPSAHVWLCV